MAVERVRVGVIGAGRWGMNHVRSCAASPQVELVGVSDLSDGQLAKVKRQYPGTKVTTDYRELLSDVDGVIVATPGSTHTDIAVEALSHGCHVLVEKPMALSAADAVRVAELARERSLQVVVGHILLFHPVVRHLKRLIETGELGKIYYLYSQRVNLGQVRPDENALWSFGPHDISVASFLLGVHPISVSANGKSYLQDGIEDVVFLNLEYPGDVMVNIQMSWLDPHKIRRTTVVGDAKMAVFDDMETREKLKVFDRGVSRPPDYASFGESLSVREGDIFIPRVAGGEPLAAEIDHFAGVIRGDEKNQSPAEDGVRVVSVLQAATESLSAGGTAVKLD